MALNPHNHAWAKAQFRNRDGLTARDAWEVWSAFLRAEQENPCLTFNPLWNIHRGEAYADFEEAMESGK